MRLLRRVSPSKFLSLVIPPLFFTDLRVMVHVSIVERDDFDCLRLQHNFLGKMVFQAVYMHVADYDKTVLRRHEDGTLSVCVCDSMEGSSRAIVHSRRDDRRRKKDRRPDSRLGQGIQGQAQVA